MLKQISVLVLAGVITVGASPVALAHEGMESNHRDGVLNRVEKGVDPTVRTVTDNEKNPLKDVREQVKSQRQQIEERKEALKQKSEQQVSERKEKLEGRRLAQCQNRQTDINALLDKSVVSGQERLVKIQRVEEGVRAFYIKYQLSSESFDSAAASADEKEVTAIAALDTLADENFACEDVDGEKPAETIRSTREAKRITLNGYRESVKDMIRIARAAYEDKQPEVKTDE